MTHILLIWTVVAMSGSNASLVQAHDWRPIVEIAGDYEKCERTARELNISKERYRCIRTK
jgi:hypothetical protein